MSPLDEEMDITFEFRRPVFKLPASPPQPWVQRRESVLRGVVDKHRIQSKILDNERRIWVYRPPRDPEGCLVLFDGLAYLEVVPTPTILDNMLADAAVPPPLTV